MSATEMPTLDGSAGVPVTGRDLMREHFWMDTFAAQGLAARIELERAGEPDLSAAFAALDADDRAQALDLLLESLPGADGARDDIRRVVVGVLDELGVDDPLARDSRRRLAAALY